MKKRVGKNSKQIHRQTQRSTRKRFVPVSDKAKKIITIGVVVSAVVVLMSLIAVNYFAPDKVAKRKLEAIATDYYENYYYDKFVASIPKDKNLETVMRDFDQDGFAQVLLRHLLLFDNERNKDFERYFETSSYICDKNTTAIKIKPVAPYGKKDYEVSYTLSCNYK